jgi:RNA polymerase sigma-70 factor (ECF subfamily)
MGLSLLQMSEQKAPSRESPPGFAEDLALVSSARRDPRAFGALYERYVSQIYRYAYVRLRNAPAAEDATSQTFLKALQALPQFRDGLFIAWLYRIAHNVVADVLRRGPLTQDFDAMEFELHADDSTEDDAILATERAAFYRAMNDLPEEQRGVLEMTLSGFKGEEIARILGKTHASVKMLRWRGMEAIKARVAQEGFLSEVEQ